METLNESKEEARIPGKKISANNKATSTRCVTGGMEHGNFFITEFNYLPILKL